MDDVQPLVMLGEFMKKMVGDFAVPVHLIGVGGDDEEFDATGCW